MLPSVRAARRVRLGLAKAWVIVVTAQMLPLLISVINDLISDIDMKQYELGERPHTNFAIDLANDQLEHNYLPCFVSHQVLGTPKEIRLMKRDDPNSPAFDQSLQVFTCFR